MVGYKELFLYHFALLSNKMILTDMIGQCQNDRRKQHERFYGLSARTHR